MNSIFDYAQVQNVRQHTLALCEPLELEDFVPQPESFVSPPKWHLAHTTWFFEEMILKPSLSDYQEFDKRFNYLFNSYYQSMGERAERSQRGIISRPTVRTVLEYRTHVDAALKKLCSQELPAKVIDLLTVGINHEQQHQELLITDLKYTFSLNPMAPRYQSQSEVHRECSTATTWHKIDKGLYDIGRLGDGFCFDNEAPRHKVYLESCEISNNLVTNAEYLEFIGAKGYQQFQYWLDDGWVWRDTNHIQQPLYWKMVENQWHCYTLAGVQPICLNAPVTHISFYEANAFAQWRGLRLPTEFEWEAASSHFDWGERWEWTASAYLGYPRYKASANAVGEYNGKFMINQMVLRGASIATPEAHKRFTYRNFFHPQFRWQYSGIRLAK